MTFRDLTPAEVRVLVVVGLPEVALLEAAFLRLPALEGVLILEADRPESLPGDRPGAGERPGGGRPHPLLSRQPDRGGRRARSRASTCSCSSSFGRSTWPPAPPWSWPTPASPRARAIGRCWPRPMTSARVFPPNSSPARRTATARWCPPPCCVPPPRCSTSRTSVITRSSSTCGSIGPRPSPMWPGESSSAGAISAVSTRYSAGSRSRSSPRPSGASSPARLKAPWPSRRRPGPRSGSGIGTPSPSIFRRRPPDCPRTPGTTSPSWSCPRFPGGSPTSRVTSRWSEPATSSWSGSSRTSCWS